MNCWPLRLFCLFLVGDIFNHLNLIRFCKAGYLRPLSLESEDKNRTLTKPDIFVIGVQHGATSTLTYLLKHNLEICSSDKKEKHFFDTDDFWRRGFDYYENLYSTCQTGELLVDSTPIFHYRDMPDRFAKVYSQTDLYHKKFILILREPVSRDFSIYTYRLKTCLALIDRLPTLQEKSYSYVRRECALVAQFSDETIFDYDIISFRDYYLKGSIRLEDGEYESHLRNWIRQIHRSQLFILNMDTLLQNSTDTLTRLRLFLGLKIGWDKDLAPPHESNFDTVEEAILDCETYNELWDYYADKNAHLDLIVNNKYKPLTEPIFPPFTKTATCERPVPKEVRQCFNVLQRNVDCGTNTGRWVPGHNLEYIFQPAMSKNLRYVFCLFV